MSTSAGWKWLDFTFRGLMRKKSRLSRSVSSYTHDMKTRRWLEDALYRHYNAGFSASMLETGSGSGLAVKPSSRLPALVSRSRLSAMF